MIFFAHATTEQEKQHIALVLLDNSSLPNFIYNKLLAIMVNKPEDTTADTYLTGIVSVSELKSVLESIQASKTPIGEVLDDLAEAAVRTAISSINTEFFDAKETLKALVNRIGVRNPYEPSRLNFTLDDAIDALKTILSNEWIPRVIQDTEPPELVNNILGIKGSRLKTGAKGHGYQNRKNSRCAACGKIGHWARDRIFPLYGKAVSGSGNSIRKGENKIEPQHKKRNFSRLNDNEEHSSDDSKELVASRKG